MPDSSVMTNVPTAAQSVPGKRPKMVLFLGAINTLLILISARLTVGDFLSELKADGLLEYNFSLFFGLALLLLMFYIIPIALLVGFYLGNRTTWYAYRALGWIGGTHCLLIFFIFATGFLSGRDHSFFLTDSYSSIQSYFFLLVTYLWLNTKAARNYFNVSPRRLRSFLFSW